MKTLSNVVLLAVALATAACGGSDTVTTYGLTVEIVDSVTGEVLTDGSTVTVEDGAYVEVIHGSEEVHDGIEPARLNAASGRAGTYTVTVTHPGYRTWTAEDVYVSSAARSAFDSSPIPETVHLRAELQREPEPSS